MPHAPKRNQLQIAAMLKAIGITTALAIACLMAFQKMNSWHKAEPTQNPQVTPDPYEDFGGSMPQKPLPSMHAVDDDSKQTTEYSTPETDTEPASPIVYPQSVSAESIPHLSLSELATKPSFWPHELKLIDSKQVEIKYNGNSYGHVEFTADSPIEVDSISPSGEVFGTVNSNYLSLSASETNLSEWFETAYGKIYSLQTNATATNPLEEPEAVKSLKTKEGQTEFWQDIKVWCYMNYESASISAEENSLVFKWLPKEDAPIDFRMEAREIARFYLLKRAERGGHENYAACEIRHPRTGELLGSGSIFIPRL